MELIATLYLIAAIAAIAACIPQVVQLQRVRCSDEFQLTTWVVWMVTQCVSLAYVISLGNILLIAASTAWVGFYTLMVILIIRYRQKAVFRFKLPRVTAAVTIHDKP